MRCKTLADELRRRGADVRFVCRAQPGHLIPLLENAGYRVEVLPSSANIEQSVDAEDTIAALNGFPVDWLIADHYDLDQEWESRLRSRVDRIFVIDDLANRRHACDVLLDQNWLEDDTRQRCQNAPQAECLMGPKYALLDPAFARVRTTLLAREGAIRRLLVFFGAVDAGNQTVKVMEALGAPDMTDLTVDVVVGHANAAVAAIDRLANARANTTLYRPLPSLADLMAKADLMLGAGGSTTTWERCCLGLPAIVAVYADNQKSFTEALAKCGGHYSLGDASAVTAAEWRNALRELRSSPERTLAYSAKARRFTDGHGTERVAAVLMPAA